MKRTRMRQVSNKRAAEQRQRRQVLRRLMDERGPWCEAALDGCATMAVDGHEVLARSAGGSITDEENILLLCRSCHTYVTEHPREATDLGLRRSRYGGAA